MKNKDKKYTLNFILCCTTLLVLQFTLLTLKWIDILDLTWYYVFSPTIVLLLIFLLMGFYVLGLILTVKIMMWGLGKIVDEINKNLEEKDKNAKFTK